MRLSAFFLLVCFSHTWAISGYSQETKLTLKMSDSKIIEVLNKIEEQSEFYFLFNQRLVDVERKVDINAESKTIDNVLQKLFAGTNVNYMIYDRQIILTTFKRELLPEQTRTVSGRVTDSSGQPLPGVTIILKGTTQGTVTNTDGDYTLPNIPDDATLVFSFVGMRTKEAVVGNQTVINMRMEEDIIGLDEVVAIGYGTVRKRDLTGSVSSIKRIEQIKSGAITSFGTILQGRISGVQVIQNSGAPGSDFTIRIRGSNSMRGGNDPLYVVDGNPISSSNVLNLLNPNDIESIDILKDASSSAIYGSRGANGVIIITTKKGKIGSTLEFESSFGLQQVAKMLPLMNARQYAKMVNDWSQQSKLPIPYPNTENLLYDTNWQKEIFQTSPIQNYFLNFNGGKENIQYNISGDYLSQEGIIISSNLRRGTLRANVDSDITSKIKMSNQFSFINLGQNQAPSDIIDHACSAPPTIPVYDENGNYFNYSDLPWWGQYSRNAIADANEVTDYTNRISIIENISVEYQILQGLVAKTFWGIDYSNYNTDSYYTQLHESGGGVGRASNIWGRSNTYLSENTLNFSNTHANDHFINATIGYTWQYSKNRSFSIQGRGFIQGKRMKT